MAAERGVPSVADHVRAAPVRGRAARLAPAGADQHRAAGRTGRAARRRCVLRAAVHARVLEDAAGRVRAPRARRPAARVGRRRRRQLPLRAQGGRRRRHARPARAPFGFTAHGIPLLPRATPRSARPTSAPACRPATSHRGPACSGRPHRVDGVVERGDQRGRELGFPTANLRTDAVDRDPGRRRLRRAGRAPRRVGPDRAGRRRSATPRSRSAPTRRSRSASAGSRPTSSTSPATSTAARSASSSSNGCAAWSSSTGRRPGHARCPPTSTRTRDAARLSLAAAPRSSPRSTRPNSRRPAASDSRR